MNGGAGMLNLIKENNRDSGEVNNVKALGRDSVQTDLNIEDPDKYNQGRDRRGSSHMQKAPSGVSKMRTTRTRVQSDVQEEGNNGFVVNRDANDAGMGFDSDQDDDDQYVRLATGASQRDRLDSEDVVKRGDGNMRPISTFVNTQAIDDYDYGDDSLKDRRDTNLMASQANRAKIARNMEEEDDF